MLFRSGVSLDKENLSLTTGESVTLAVTIEPDNATNKAVTWTSDDEGVAMVEQDGKVTAQGPGDTIIRVKTADGDFEATCSVKVTEPVEVDGISLNRTSFTIRINGTERLVATITPDDATNKDVIWRSDDDGVASVEHDGTVTAVANGTTTITVTTVDGDYEATCAVTGKTPVDLDTLGQYTELDATTDGTAGTSGTYVTFGTWPQTIKASDVTIDEIEANKLVVGMFTYYMGSDGEWYCKALEQQFDNKNWYKYSDGTPVAPKWDNSYKWFKIMPIKWRVLNTSSSKATSSSKLLLAEVALHTGVPYYDNLNECTGKATIYPNNYYSSRIRAVLNGLTINLGGTEHDMYYKDRGFLQTAFTENQQNVILETNVDNSNTSTNPNSDPKLWNNGDNEYACANTKDKIFLLSTQEITSSDYGFEYKPNAVLDNSRVRKWTDFALANNAYFPNSSYGAIWALRSPGWSNGTRNKCVKFTGVVDADVLNVNIKYNAIVPALCVQP